MYASVCFFFHDARLINSNLKLQAIINRIEVSGVENQWLNSSSTRWSRNSIYWHQSPKWHRKFAICDPVLRNESEVAHVAFLINTKLGQTVGIFKKMLSSLYVPKGSVTKPANCWEVNFWGSPLRAWLFVPCVPLAWSWVLCWPKEAGEICICLCQSELLHLSGWRSDTHASRWPAWLGVNGADV